MKEIFIFFLLSTFSFQSFSQQKEDFLDCFELVFEINDVESMMEKKLQFFEYVVIMKPDRLAFYPKPADEVIFYLEDEDLWDLPFPIKMKTKTDYQIEEINKEQVLDLWVKFDEDQILITFQTWITEKRRFFIGQFNFENKAGNWKIINQNIDE